MADITTNRVVADGDAFAAYNVLMYDLFADGAPLHGKEIDVRCVALEASDIACAESAAANLASATSYALSRAGVFKLAMVNAVLRAAGCSIVYVDPLADILSMTDEKATGKPMYPDYPNQVLEMSENDFRSHQAAHYASTYGVEFVASLFGADINVHNGWLPDVTESEKTHGSASKQTPKHILELVFSCAQVAVFPAAELSRPARMCEPAMRLATRLYESGDLDVSGDDIAFHENMMGIIGCASGASSEQLQRVLDSLCQHPGDVLKAVLYISALPRHGADSRNHLSTIQKKALCRSIERFDAANTAANIADLSIRGQKAINMLSIKRFGGKNLRAARALVESGSIRSFNARIEKLVNSVVVADSVEKRDKASDELLRILATRPGVMLRSLRRLLICGVPADKIADVLCSVADKLSPATLVRLVTVMKANDSMLSAVERFRREDAFQKNARNYDSGMNQVVGDLALRALRTRLAGVVFPFNGKKVFVDPCGFSLAGSIVMPNDSGNASNAYPPAGMAYALPNDGTVRFFTFWDDREKRVDVDIHFAGYRADGADVYVGWNSSYANNGLVTSGDITTSENSAEFLDIDLRTADKNGIVNVTQEAHIYSGAHNWHEIDTCFSGALLVDDTDRDATIYDGRGILFHDDMNGDGKLMSYATINIPERWVRIIRGADIKFYTTDFTLNDYIDILLETHGCTRVDDVSESEAVLNVGRQENLETNGDKPVACLVDDGFYLA